MRRVLTILLLATLAVGMTACCRPCRRGKPAEVKGVQWALLELQDKVIDRLPDQRPERFTLTLGEDGRIGGRGDCNTYFTSYSLNGNRIEIGGIASTRMLCPDQALENTFFRTLESAVQVSIDSDFLILLDKDGRIIASFKKVS